MPLEIGHCRFVSDVIVSWIEAVSLKSRPHQRRPKNRVVVHLDALPIMARHASLLEGLPFFLGDAAKFITGGQFKAAADIERVVAKMA
jgi:hypothetical protein